MVSAVSPLGHRISGISQAVLVREAPCWKYFPGRSCDAVLTTLHPHASSVPTLLIHPKRGLSTAAHRPQLTKQSKLQTQSRHNLHSFPIRAPPPYLAAQPGKQPQSPSSRRLRLKTASPWAYSPKTRDSAPSSRCPDAG